MLSTKRSVFSTFYTRRPPTAERMNSIIGRFGHDGIVVSLYECLERYPQIRRLLADSSVNLPGDPRILREWSLVMAFTGVLNAIDRGLIGDEPEVVVHGSGSYATSDFAALGARDHAGRKHAGHRSGAARRRLACS
jgi:hypothetical protein